MHNTSHPRKHTRPKAFLKTIFKKIYVVACEFGKMSVEYRKTSQQPMEEESGNLWRSALQGRNRRNVYFIVAL
jgi:hypothetical protein